jgi:hypothetical protein
MASRKKRKDLTSKETLVRGVHKAASIRNITKLMSSVKVLKNQQKRGYFSY